jgi:membrane protease YdiL (CAAX protease family)
MIFYIGTGFFLGIITLLDEGLELALGFHAANNLVTALLVTADWTAFQTASIYKDVAEPTLNWEILIPVLVIYPILILIFAKKYGWTQFKEKLFGRVLSADEAQPLLEN